MELLYRRGNDAFVRPGAYRELEARLREKSSLLDEIPAVVLSCMDPATRLLPFNIYDKMLFPAGARSVAGTLVQAGFKRVRALFQLWTPNFRPSQARIDGRVPQMLLVSSMQLHSRRAFEAVRDAWLLGEQRPLIIVGGPKAFHEAYHFWPLQTAHGPVSADVAVTGESYILLDLLNVLMEYHRPGEHIRKAFERARQEGALNSVPGLVYQDPQTTLMEPQLIDTGLQRLVQHLDELPDEVAGFSVLEGPHRKATLSPAPLPANRVRRYASIASLVITQGCKFNCSYCPIPALNQKTWRYRSPENLAHQFRSVREKYGIKFFFGADDNFMNRRETAVDYFETLSRAEIAGKKKSKRLGSDIRWGTEATQRDTYQNKDLLPIARRSGLSAIWFGIEDLTAELINKGQKPEVTADLFQLMHQNKICPMAMMMFHAGQPFHTPGELYGLKNQMDFLRNAGAISVQVTTHTPAVGTREYGNTYAGGNVINRVGSYEISEADIDGNHVIVSDGVPLWKKQMQLLGGYLSFYNPLNLFRALRDDGSPLRFYRIGYQVAGFIGAVRTAFRLVPYMTRLMFAKKEYATEAPPKSRVPVRLAPGAFPRFLKSEFYDKTQSQFEAKKVA